MPSVWVHCLDVECGCHVLHESGARACAICQEKALASLYCVFDESGFCATHQLLAADHDFVFVNRLFTRDEVRALYPRLKLPPPEKETE